jgi:hypothetical protein
MEPGEEAGVAPVARTYSHVVPYRSWIRGEPARPYLHVRLGARSAGAAAGAQEPFVLGLIDSGCDATLFNSALALYLGLTLEAGQPLTLHGVGGPLDCWQHELDVTVFEHQFTTLVAFAHDWPTDFGLLGLNGLFRHFAIGFEEPARRVLLQPFT